MEEEAPRILIVDDDLDFASLLSDVFTQASYEVEMTGDPTKVENKVRSMDFSLVVTDLRMPGINGFELSRKIREIKPDLPIIMVSGFLESKDREKMEAEGIVGLYEKPLSVFSLLKNAAKLIAEQKSKTKKGLNRKIENSVEDSSDLGFPFSALPCKSEASHAFAESIFRMRNRRQNLCIITPKGTPDRAIAEDFFSWMDRESTGCHILEAHELSLEKMADFTIEAGQKNWENLVICIPETDRLDPSQQKQLARGSRKGTFREHWEGHIRFLFMISSDVESLYQEGILSDDLYLSMGGAEIHAPRLHECPEDIESIARALETESGSAITWDGEAIRVLCQAEWPGNYAELRKVLLRLQQNYSGRPITTRDVLESLNMGESVAPPTPSTHHLSLFESLDSCRSSYLHALADLNHGDVDIVANIAKVPRTLVQQILAN